MVPGKALSVVHRVREHREVGVEDHRLHRVLPHLRRDEVREYRHGDPVGLIEGRTDPIEGGGDDALEVRRHDLLRQGGQHLPSLHPVGVEPLQEHSGIPDDGSCRGVPRMQLQVGVGLVDHPLCVAGGVFALGKALRL